MKPWAVIYSPSTKALNSFSHEAYNTYLQSINKGTELIQPERSPSVHQHWHWTHSAMKLWAVIYSPSIKALNSFSHEAYSSNLQSINTGTELIQPWNLKQLPSVHQHRHSVSHEDNQHRHWTQSAMKPTAVTYSQSTQALNSVSHEAYSSYLQSINIGTELIQPEQLPTVNQHRHWTQSVLCLQSLQVSWGGYQCLCL